MSASLMHLCLYLLTAVTCIPPCIWVCIFNASMHLGLYVQTTEACMPYVHVSASSHNSSMLQCVCGHVSSHNSDLHAHMHVGLYVHTTEDFMPHTHVSVFQTTVACMPPCIWGCHSSMAKFSWSLAMFTPSCTL